MSSSRSAPVKMASVSQYTAHSRMASALLDSTALKHWYAGHTNPRSCLQDERMFVECSVPHCCGKGPSDGCADESPNLLTRCDGVITHRSILQMKSPIMIATAVGAAHHTEVELQRHCGS